MCTYLRSISEHVSIKECRNTWEIIKRVHVKSEEISIVILIAHDLVDFLLPVVSVGVRVQPCVCIHVQLCTRVCKCVRLHVCVFVCTCVCCVRVYVCDCACL